VSEKTLGINGLGRIGKLTVWNEISERRFGRLVVNVGRPVGRSVDDVVQYLENDSTYGSLGVFLHGNKGSTRCIRVVQSSPPVLDVEGIRVEILTEHRNPREIGWGTHGVDLVVDTTGAFLDPNAPSDDPKGSLRGHLEAGARAVVVSAAFKVKGLEGRWPEDAAMFIYGINHHAFDPGVHSMVSAASCTTTALAHMMLPLLNHELTRNMLTAAMSTIHAATNSQSVLDSVPKAGAKDLRKTRSALNNIILTSTGAARALEHVIPTIRDVGFIADSVRVPIQTASLIILNCTFQTELDERGDSVIRRETLNEIYRQYAELPDSGVVYSERQNVSTDMIGHEAAVTIEAVETHTRTGMLRIDLGKLRLPGLEGTPPSAEIPVTHAKIAGWYDNELGSYSRRMSKLCHHIADSLE